MIKTIKVEKQMHIGELLEYVRKNELRGRYFRVMNESRYIKITPGGVIYFDADFCFRPDDTFTVEVEEEIDYDTIFEEVYRVTKEGKVTSDKNKSIGDCLDWKDYQVQIFAMLDGKLKLIWETE